MAKTFPYTRGFFIENALRSFVAEGGNASAALRAVGLPEREEIDPGDIVSCEQYYELMHVMTDLLGDPYFPARTGQRYAREGLTAIVEARNASKTIGEFLTRVQSTLRRAVTSGIYELHNDGMRAKLSIKRRLATKTSSAPIDTLNAAAFITMFSDELGKSALCDCIAIVPEPAALPSDILPSKQVFKAKDGTMRLQFPADWLHASFRTSWGLKGVSEEAATFKPVNHFEVDVLRLRIAARLGATAPTLEAVASDFALSGRRLQRLLKEQGHTFRELLHEERLKCAQHLLETTNNNLAEVAYSAGFSSAQALSKSFRAAFGETPSGFRSRIREHSYGR
jgi:AraC-like DNA-binding protein